MHIDNFIEKYDIKQIYTSISLIDFRKYKHFDNYSNNELNTIFFGVYRKEDIKNIINHKGNAWILWYDNDCNPNYKQS